ncbi:hypothetical protein HD554DRAFT_2131720 [Boletus coccyginus]|nr:hypothetical protein HD554DRAFT_2131720 [Boletus coccyginus]
MLSSDVLPVASPGELPSHFRAFRCLKSGRWRRRVTDLASNKPSRNSSLRSCQSSSRYESSGCSSLIDERERHVQHIVLASPLRNQGSVIPRVCSQSLLICRSVNFPAKAAVPSRLKFEQGHLSQRARCCRSKGSMPRASFPGRRLSPPIKYAQQANDASERSVGTVGVTVRILFFSVGCWTLGGSASYKIRKRLYDAQVPGMDLVFRIR